MPKNDKVYRLDIDFGPDIAQGGIHEHTTGTLDSIKEKYSAKIPGFTVAKRGGALLAFASLTEAENSGDSIGTLTEV